MGGAFTATTESFRYWLVKNKDILPILLKEKADVGYVGSDVYDEFCLGKKNCYLEFEPISEPIGYLALATTVELVDSLNQKICNGEKISVSTSYPRTLTRFAMEKSLNMVPVFEPYGSVEAMISLGISETVFDIVQSGQTLLDNSMTILIKDRSVLLGEVKPLTEVTH